jgi:hypothetical protein
LLGLGLFYAYYHYVLGPAKIRKPSFAKSVGAYALLGFGLLFIYYYYVIGPAKIKFSVTSEITISMAERNLRSNYWWVFTFDKSGVAFPVTDMFYVRVTNRDSKPLLIIHYSVEVRQKGARWRSATRIETRGAHFFIVDPVHGLTGALEVTPRDPILEEIVVDKNIAPNEAIRGWCFIERPEGYDADLETREWRFKIKDVDGAEATAIMSPAVAKRLDETFLRGKFNAVDRKDITAMTAIYYSEKSKLP